MYLPSNLYIMWLVYMLYDVSKVIYIIKYENSKQITPILYACRSYPCSFIVYMRDITVITTK